MKAINLDGHNEYNIEEVDGDYFIYYSLSEQWNLDMIKPQNKFMKKNGIIGILGLIIKSINNG